MCKYMSDVRLNNGASIRSTPIPMRNGAAPAEVPFLQAFSLVERLVEVVKTWLLQSFHKKPSTPNFATVTPQVTLSGDTCVKTRTVLSSNPLSMGFFAGDMFSRACTFRVTSVFKGPVRCWWSRGGQPANFVRQRLVSCQRPAEVDLVGSETDSRLRGCAGNSTPVSFEIAAIGVPVHVPELPPESDCSLYRFGFGKRWWIASDNM